MNYEFWKQSLAGEKPRMFVDDPRLGFYRKAIKERDANGNNKRVGWLPVAIYLNAEKVIVARVGSQDMDGDALNELWSYVAGNPITEAEYRSVAELGRDWSDAKAAEIPAANRDVAKSDNEPPTEASIPLDVEHATAIDNAIGAGKDLPVTTVAEAEIAAGAANIIRDRRLAAEKVSKRIVQPLKDAYEDERDKWLPSIKRAKEAEDAIRLNVSTFEVAERKRVAAEQLAALEKQNAIDEANQRAADRAIANGEPEPMPVVEEIIIPQAAPEKTKPTYGSYTPRAKPILKFAVINNKIEVCHHFINHPDLVALLEKLATDAIRSGQIVAGASYREGLV